RRFEERPDDAAVEGGEHRVSYELLVEREPADGAPVPVGGDRDPEEAPVGHPRRQRLPVRGTSPRTQPIQEPHQAPRTSPGSVRFAPTMKVIAAVAIGSSGVSWYAVPRTKATFRVSLWQWQWPMMSRPGVAGFM